MPVVGDDLARQDRDRVRAEQGIEALHQPEGGDRAGDIDMRAHAPRMDPGVGAAGAEHLHRLTGEAVDRLLDRLLDAGAVGLPLPAHEGAAVILHRQRKACHARRVPAGMGKPRSSSADVMAPRPARWRRVGRSAVPLPQAMVR